jgi:hypothetical protein
MYKIDIQVDAKESAAIERRRIREEQRKSRIFNARDRIIGVCLYFLLIYISCIILAHPISMCAPVFGP